MMDQSSNVYFEYFNNKTLDVSSLILQKLKYARAVSCEASRNKILKAQR